MNAGEKGGTNGPSPGRPTSDGVSDGVSDGESGGAPGHLPGASIAANLPPAAAGMGPTAARWLERVIIATCVIAILMIFQPFSMALFSWGCALVVFGALAFNLVPFCRADVSWAQVRKVVLIVLIVLGVSAALGISTAWLYVRNLGALG